VGDGAIAQSLSFLFENAVPGLDVRLLDISARETWAGERTSASGSTPRGFKLPSVRRLIGSRAVNVVRWQLQQGRHARARWPEQLRSASGLIIGGGLLIMDNNLDFPLKLSALVRMAQNQGVPVHFAACGVGNNRPWSNSGRRLLHQALSAAETVTLRDAISQHKLAEFMPDIATEVTLDPAVFARDVFGPPVDMPGSEVVGLGVIHVDKINAYNRDKPQLTSADTCAFWLELAALLLRQGVRPSFFCNGSERDHQFAQEIAAQARRQHGLEIPVEPRPTRPAQLAHTIARFSGVVVFRLHASILATAYRIPSVGLAWDRKVPAFYSETNRDDLCFSLYDCTPGDVVEALQRAMAAGISAEDLTAWKARARRSVTVPLRRMGIGALP
jgi:polysaccharide pyruvyl transferase WcaK-like protein